MSDYIMDMRKSLNKLKEEFLNFQNISLELLDSDFIKKYSIKSKKMSYEQDHYPCVYTEDLKVGDNLYVFEDGYWVEIEITHLYGGVIFYKFLEAPTDNEKWCKEKYIAKESVMALRCLYPKKVVITKDYEFTCNCPRVEFIYDEDMDNKYSSIFENTDERYF